MSIVVYNEVAEPIVPTPLSLQVLSRFGSSIAGMYDFTGPHGLYQDAAGTVPVTDYGQPIGLVRGAFGGPLSLTQATTAARPTYTPQGARHDGVDDYLQAALADDWTFLHDGSGGALGTCMMVYDEDGGGGNKMAGTRTSGVGFRTGVANTTSMQRSADVTGTSGTYQAVTSTGQRGQFYSLIGVSGEGEVRLFELGSLAAESPIADLTDDAPQLPLRTMVTASGRPTALRRLIAIREAVTDPADIALIDAWLREGA